MSESNERFFRRMAAAARIATGNNNITVSMFKREWLMTPAHLRPALRKEWTKHSDTVLQRGGVA